MRKIKYILFILGILIAASSSGHGGLIKGSVSDSLSSEFLIGATIVLNDNQEITSTDQLGKFKLTFTPGDPAFLKTSMTFFF